MPDIWMAPAGTPPPVGHDSSGNPVSLTESGATQWEKIGATVSVPFYFPPEAEDG